MPIVDTAVLFAAGDDTDRFHRGAVAVLRKLGGKVLLGGAALIEFDVVLKSRGFSPEARREETILLMLEFPSTASSIHCLGPQTVYLAALYEEQFGLDYFDSMVAAEAAEHDSSIISSDREFEKIPGLRRISI
jgi:predicted nucleic acid-binding protein